MLTIPTTLTGTMIDEPFPSVPTPQHPHFVTLPAHPCHRKFPYAPPQQKKRLQDLLAEQRAQNKLAKAFDESLALWNTRTARPGSDGGVYSIIDTAIKTNVDTLNFVSTGLTAADFDPYEQGHVIHTRLYRGYRVAATVANSKHQGGVAVAWRVESKKGQGKPTHDIESFQRHGPNCLSYLYRFGAFKWPVIVAYLLPDTLEDLHHVQAAFDRFATPDREHATPILMADLNVDLYSVAPDLRCRAVADLLAANGMEDILQHFHSRRKFN